MEQDKVRAEFEAAMNAEAESGGYEVDWSRSEVDADRYANPSVRTAWWAWKASREAVAVELPDPYQTAKRYMHSEAAFAHKEGIDECRAAIEAAGIRTR